jgi:hypothetical protein
MKGLCPSFCVGKAQVSLQLQLWELEKVPSQLSTDFSLQSFFPLGFST